MNIEYLVQTLAIFTWHRARNHDMNDKTSFSASLLMLPASGRPGGHLTPQYVPRTSDTYFELTQRISTKHTHTQPTKHIEQQISYIHT